MRLQTTSRGESGEGIREKLKPWRREGGEKRTFSEGYLLLQDRICRWPVAAGLTKAVASWEEKRSGEVRDHLQRKGNRERKGAVNGRISRRASGEASKHRAAITPKVIGELKRESQLDRALKSIISKTANR